MFISQYTANELSVTSFLSVTRELKGLFVAVAYLCSPRCLYNLCVVLCTQNNHTNIFCQPIPHRPIVGHFASMNDERSCHLEMLQVPQREKKGKSNGGECVFKSYLNSSRGV